MTLQLPHPWECQLVGWAEEALHTQSPRATITADSTLLETAYHHCDTMIRLHSRTFYLSSGLLPEEKRRAARALYAFCRVTDNIVDSNHSKTERLTHLENWRAIVASENPPDNELVALSWADTQQKFNIPRGYAEQLIDGVARDLNQFRYATFNDLAGYAYGVASTVGLMAMHIIGFTGEEALPYAVKLGVALQLTNILRDIAEDWHTGRLYLPQDELEAFKVTEETIQRGEISQQWREFMKFQINRNRALYQESWAGLRLLDRNGRFAIGAAIDLYQAILEDIERHDYNVFSRRAHIGLLEKCLRLPGIWWRSHN